MTTPTPIVLGASPPAPLPPIWRFSGDAWAGGNALAFRVYSSGTVASDGTVSGGTPLSLAGYTPAGGLQYREGPRRRIGMGGPPTGGNPALPVPTAATVDAAAGIFSLSFPSTATAFPRQDEAEWAEGASLLIVRPALVDPQGNLVTVGLQPLFVF